MDLMTAERPNQPTLASPPKARARRATRTGVVTSSARNKTIGVTTTYMVRHAKYGKYIKRQTVYHAHDEQNECHDGDVVEIAQTRPISKTKCWRLVKVLKRAPAERGTPS
jgi:small subunit ribosomal protein S17